MIRRLHVQNFKSLRDVHLNLGTRNVLVGPNMSGKSNLLQVFRFLLHLVGPPPVSGVAAAINAFGGFAELAWRGGDSNLLSIELEGDLPKVDDEQHAVTWNYRIDLLGNRRQHTPVTVQDEVLRYRSDLGEVQVIAKDPTTGNRLLRNREGPELSQIVDNTRSALEYEIPGWDGTRFRTILAASRFYRLIPELMKRPRDRGGARSR